MSSSVMWRLCEASYRRRFAYFLIRRSWLMRRQCTSGVLRRNKGVGARPVLAPAGRTGRWPPAGARPRLPGGHFHSRRWHPCPQQQVLERLQAQVGQEVHCSDWFEVTQERINAFADGDRRPPVDPRRPGAGRARVARGKATIAHGYLTLSLYPMLRGLVGRRQPAVPGRQAGRSTTASTSCASRARCESAAASARAACC